ncbi:MAG TPA: TPM domain-containing protein [Candidatus Gracilibacteria bacterium]
MKKLLILILFLLSLGLSLTQAQDIPKPSDYVEDLAGVLSLGEKAALSQQIKTIQDETNAQIGLLLVTTTWGRDISEYTIATGQAWGVGNKADNNGLMIVVATDDRAWFAATGYGLEGVLPDLLVHRIGETYFPPNFRQGLYANGLSQFLHEVSGVIKNDPETMARWENPSLEFKVKDKTRIIVLVIATLILGGLFFLPSKHEIKFSQRLGFAGFIVFHFLFLAGSFLFALGFFIFFLLFCFYIIFPLSMIITGSKKGGGSGWSSGSSWSSGSGFSSSSSSSSFGGFGGGSFGGGGGGGRW